MPGNDLWKGGVGAFYFAAEDPAFGPATLSCRATGREWAEKAEFPTVPIENEMSSEVDGTTCTVAWLPGASATAATASSTSTASPWPSTHTSLTASLPWWRVRRASRSRPSAGAVSRSRTPSPCARRADASSDRRRPVSKSAQRRGGSRCALDPATRRALREKGFLLVRGSVRHIDGSAGGGYTTTQLVLRTSGHT